MQNLQVIHTLLIGGDLDPATKKMSGNYGERYEGCITEKESLITPENGFEKIELLDTGISPLSIIDARDKEYQKQMNRGYERKH